MCVRMEQVFKQIVLLFLSGPYEKGKTSYKHVYFNVTSNVLKIWILTVLAVITLYETMRRVIQLTIVRHLRYSMACLLSAVIYPHYYSW